MHKRYFLKLVRKHLKGKSSAEEEQLLLSYYSLFEYEPDVLLLLNEEEKQKIKSQINAAIWEGISKHDNSKGKIRRLKIIYIRAAAAILIGAIIACSVFLFRLHNERLIANKQGSGKYQNRLVHLPDGSTVIIMKDSKLTYLPIYNKMGKREVYLEGQAYFDVKHNPSSPFIVHTGNIKTIVLGTAFNIKAIKGDNNVIVTVTRGKVSVSNKNKVLGSITPNQQMVINTGKARPVLQKIDADAYLLWKKQDLLFDDVTMEEASKLLKDRFKVDIVFTDPKLMSNRFTTTFRHDETLEDELTIICEFNNAAYTYDKEHAKVIINNKTN